MKSARTVLVFFFLALPVSVFAQTEIIAKIKSNRTELIHDFTTLTNKNSPPSQISSVKENNSVLKKSTACNSFLKSSSQNNRSASEFSSVFLLSFSADVNSDSLISAMQQSGVYEYAEYNRTVKLDLSPPPNDPKYNEQWYIPLIKADRAWDKTRGNASVLIGIIDTGIDFSHPELINRIYLNLNEIINSMDDDANGYVDDRRGWDFVDQPRYPFGGDYLFEDDDAEDENSHGTIVAGIIAAEQNNGFGISGIAPQCKIVPLRAFSAAGVGEDDDISRAIIYAADNGIKILNFSFGDIYPSQLMHDAIKYAYDKGVVMIASAGNTTGDDVHYPSNYPEVIAVSGSSYDKDTGYETISQTSNYGLTTDLCAPGEFIYTTTFYNPSYTDSSFDYFSGTSVAAPMVTAASALLRSLNSGFTPQQIRGILSTSADDIMESGWDHYTGGGRLNIDRALCTVGASIVEITSPENDGGSANDTVNIIGTVLDPMFQSYALEYSVGTENPVFWNPIITNQLYQRQNETLAVWNIKNLPDTTYTLRLKANRSNGMTSENQIRFIKDTSPPTVAIKLNTLCYDNNEEKILIVYRSSDAGTNQLYYKPSSSTEWSVLTNDLKTKNGHFLLENSLVLPNTPYDFYVHCTNAAGLTGQSLGGNFTPTHRFISQFGFNEKTYTIPFGHYLPKAYDFDTNSLKEVVINKYDDKLNETQIYFYEINGANFIARDSIVNPGSTFFPSDVSDWNSNSLLDLLVYVSDSFYVYRQPMDSTFPTQLDRSRLGGGYYAAGFSKANGGNDEIVAKQNTGKRENYYLFDPNNLSVPTFTLLDKSEDCDEGATVPRFVEGDFDNDGSKEIVFGTYCGDFLVYEWNGSTFTNTFVDSTDLVQAGQYIVSGDFDGDGKPEFMVLTRTSQLRNKDFEYDTPYWDLRIFKSFADNSYSVVWEKYIYEVATPDLNGCTVGNLDAIADDEIVLSIFPKTYIIDYSAGKYDFIWFKYGTLATHHVIGDFDNDGWNEVAIGTDSVAHFFEIDHLYTGPKPVAGIIGYVADTDSIVIKWQDAGVPYYRIWRGDSCNGFISPLIITPDTFFYDFGLTKNSLYLYVVTSVDSSLSPVESPLTMALGICLRPHARNRLDSVQYIGNNKIIAYFSNEVSNANLELSDFKLASGKKPVSAVAMGNITKKILLSFKDYMADGTDTLLADTLFLDADFGLMDINFTADEFTIDNSAVSYVFLTRWYTVSNQEAVLQFNTLMDNSAVGMNNYEITPQGKIKSVRWEGSSQDVVKITIEEAAFGALGNPISVRIKNMTSLSGLTTKENQGDVATFLSYKNDLSEAFVYPNPYKPNVVINGIRFANLTKQATITIYSVDGRFIKKLEEPDESCGEVSDGGLFWDLRDLTREAVHSGVYVYRIETKQQGVSPIIGKFVIIK